MSLSRRGFLSGLAAALAAPAIVRAEILMPIRGIVMDAPLKASQFWAIPAEGWYLYTDELSDILREEIVPLTRIAGPPLDVNFNRIQIWNAGNGNVFRWYERAGPHDPGKQQQH